MRGREWDRLGGSRGCGYWLPDGWQESEASEAWLEDWRPGDALLMVTGHAADGFDCDPRHGGEASVAEQEAQGKLPAMTGRQETPSGGWHDLIAPLGVGSINGARPGLDVKSGKPGGDGRGFLWIAPTVRPSKTTGETGLYRWTKRPDVAALAGDRSGEALAAIIREGREAKATKAPADPLAAPRPSGSDLVAGYRAKVAAGSARHDAMLAAQLALVAAGDAEGLEALREAFLDDVAGEPGRGDAEREWEAALEGARRRIETEAPAPEAKAEDLFITGGHPVMRHG